MIILACLFKNINISIDMSDSIKISRGLSIQLQGEASKVIKEVSSSEYALKPTDFTGVFPKLLVAEGDKVKAGTPVFYDRYRQNLRFPSPVSGTITEIRRGAKRKLLEIRIKKDETIDYESYLKGDPTSLKREEIVETLVKSGVWAYIRQRPYDIIANPVDIPRSIYISTFDTHPLAPDFNFIYEKENKAFQAGLDVLNKLTEGKVYLGVHQDMTNGEIFKKANNVEIVSFSGKHPSGNVGIQIHHTEPINKGEKVWYLNPFGVIVLGKFFSEGKYDASKIIAVNGSEVKNPQYYKVVSGIKVDALLKDNLNSENIRVISGNVLTGHKISTDGYLGFYDEQITVIPEGDYHEFLGWGMPRFHKFSYSKSYFSWLTPGKKYRHDTNLNGGKRAFVLTGEYEKVFPMNIFPMQLLKAIIAKDIDRMEQLGIYEVAPEDFALCEYIDPSKTDMQAIVRDGLDYLYKEME